jgi:multiple sugar transport system permease protein
MELAVRKDKVAGARFGLSISRGQRYLGQSRWAGLLFVLPSIVMVTVFFLVPLGMLFWMSLYDWPLIGQRHFIGLDNYAAMLGDRGFWGGMVFTLKYTLAMTIGVFLVAFPLALFVERPRPGVGVFRTAFFLPVVIGVSSASLMWVWLLNVNSGLFSPALQALGIIDAPLQVLAALDSAFLAIVIMMVWKTAGFTMVLLLTGLQSIPAEIDEAARIDGATAWQRFRLITLPLIRRPVTLALILVITGASLGFDQFYIMTAGGPRNQTLTAVYWIFTTSFMSFRLGYGATLSLVLLCVLLAVSVLQLRLLRGKEHD